MVENNSSNDITIELGVNVGLDYNDLELPSNGHLFNEYENVPNSPELDDGMIAVSYNGENWVKAEVNNTDSNWYNYDEQKWANAVTVSSTTRESYKNASVGTVVNMDDIETMWVWIPRYSYSIGSVDGTNYYGKKGCYLESNPTLALPGEIDIRFVSNNIKDRGTARYVTTSRAREYYTPDAFTFGDEELSGIWVGKFETSSSNPSASYGGGNTTELDPLVKPNVTSWRYISMSNAFAVAKNMINDGNRYGFNNEIDIHVLKSSEWGAVAYLSQSKYGKLANTSYSGANKEVYQNKSDSFITGCSYGSPSNGNTDYGCQYTYDVDINGTGASTTGNIYGIYDMSGGAHDAVMGNYNGIISSSEFVTMPEEKYYDMYTSNDVNTACNGTVCLSYAISETFEWYNDSKMPLDEQFPWMVRGGYYNTNDFRAGVFYFGKLGDTLRPGGYNSNVTFRLVIS